MGRLSVAAALLALPLLSGCGGDESSIPSGAVALVASSDIGQGAERFLIGVNGPDNSRLGGPDDQITIEVAPESAPDQTQSAEGVWTWIVEGSHGLYRAQFDFDRPGLWVATVTPSGGDPLEAAVFEVKQDTSAPALGEDAPAAPTPTLDEMSIEELSTDPDPDPTFYEMSLGEALSTGRRTVLVFSTPAYCQTATCGPLLDHVKEIAPGHPDVNFIHVEVYTGLLDPDFQPDAAHLAPSAGSEWYALPSEPWVFLIDEGGKIAGRYEGVMDPAELDAALSG